MFESIMIGVGVIAITVFLPMFVMDKMGRWKWGKKIAKN